MAKAEAVIQKEIIRVLSINGYMAWRMYTGPVIHRSGNMSPNPSKGMPDVMAIKDGQIYCIEVKGPNTKLAKHQKQWLDKAEEHGARCYVVRNADEFLTELGLRNLTETPIEALINGSKKKQDELRP